MSSHHSTALSTNIGEASLFGSSLMSSGGVGISKFWSIMRALGVVADGDSASTISTSTSVGCSAARLLGVSGVASSRVSSASAVDEETSSPSPASCSSGSGRGLGPSSSPGSTSVNVCRWVSSGGGHGKPRSSAFFWRQSSYGKRSLRPTDFPPACQCTTPSAQFSLCAPGLPQLEKGGRIRNWGNLTGGVY